ncbi:MAG: hypothetical protein K8S98_18635 [Planctomycetes bacterium]|nr:hypothetical protein [Planctomycetota bacterium]
MNAEASILEREGATFGRYLGAGESSHRALAKYREAHELGVVVTSAASTRFDRALVGFARLGTFATRLADTHARLFRKGGLLRRKLVLLLAILETHADTADRVDAPTVGSPAVFVVEVAFRLIVFAVLALVGLVVFLPLRVVCAFGSAR